jgi:hypothetical protein
MGVFTDLGKLFRRTDAAPLPMPRGFRPEGLDTSDHHETTVDAHLHATITATGAVTRHADGDLWGISISIEYQDAQGAFSRRRVTLRRLYHTATGELCLGCFCHERQALRTFRFDRIHSVIDGDGVVWKPAVFFERELHVHHDVLVTQAPKIPISEIMVRPKQPPHDAPCLSTPVARQPPGYAQRSAARDGLRVLIALSRADGRFNDAELGIVLGYVVDTAARAGIRSDDADRRALTTYLRHQMPAAAVLASCLERLESMPIGEKRYFAGAALAITAADHAQRAAAAELMRQIHDHLGDGVPL